MTNTTNKTIEQLAEELKANLNYRAPALADFIDALDPSDKIERACFAYADSEITRDPAKLIEWVQTMGGIAGAWMSWAIQECDYCARPAYYDFYDHVRCAWVKMETDLIKNRVLKDAIRFSALVSLDSITTIDGYLTAEEIERLPAFLDRCAECITGDDLIDEWDSFKEFLTLSRRFTA